MARKMKDSGVEWIGSIPENWKMVRVKNIFSNHKNIVGDKEAEYERLSLTLSGVLKRPKDDSKGLQSESLSTYQILNERELVFKMIDLENVNTSRVGYSLYTGIVSPVYIILNNEKYTRYGYYYFYNMWQRAIFNQLGNNGVRSALNASDMLNLPFPQISHEDAEKIADFLDEKVGEINRIIDKTKNSIEEYKKYRQTVITEIVTKGLSKNVPMKNSSLQWVKEIPEHWETKKILHIIDMPVVDGPHVSPELVDEGIPYISADAIENGRINFDRKRGFITEEYSKECNKRYKPQKDDILVVKLGASTGKMGMVGEDTNFNIWVPLAVVRCKNGINPKYIFYSMESFYFKNEIKNGWTFGTQETLGVKTLEQLYVFLPTEKEQEEIVKFLDKKVSEIDVLIEKKEAFVSEMEAYKKSLIYEYVTGKKEVL